MSGYLALAAIIALFAYFIWDGYRAEMALRPLTLREIDGVMEPVCPACNTRLIPVRREQPTGLARILAFILAALGIAMMWFNVIAGAILLICAILLDKAGRRAINVLTCPACGQGAHPIR